MQKNRLESALSGGNSTTFLNVHVVPRAREYSIKYDESRRSLIIRVKAPPHRGKANRDLLAFLGRFFKKPLIVSGAASRSKRVSVQNTMEETILILKEMQTCTPAEKKS